MQKVKFYIVTGLSGAGKTTVIRCFEDMGFFCIDNLPPVLLTKFAAFIDQTEGKIDKVALVIDVRGGEFFKDLIICLKKLQEIRISYEILFLDATDETLVRRFVESRRQHPLKPGGSLLEGIEEERSKLSELKGMADRIINTSNLTRKQLKERIYSFYYDQSASPMQISLLSFGYKYGIPLDVDWVFDVRFLDNPFYVPELKALSGNDREVRDYVLDIPECKVFINKIIELFDFLIPGYIQEGKLNLTIAVGCTGGQHRSVAIANALGERFNKMNYRTIVGHRDVSQVGGQ